ncbi:hypothetical protein XH94_37090 [Bradyrhizobium zhanjiangense]|uniref:Uncharacterized protein n=1 Tax=Bradyrhizobium zhanjiangense TaxID=1325107 RepID=A0A4Q0RVL8_9BRAD|nr:hypothetical protein XH94_37090 [Bradyrhizobium zhanjiangense]
MVEQRWADPGFAAAADGALAKCKAASAYSRENVVSEFVKNVASTSMDYSFAKACATGMETELASAELTSVPASRTEAVRREYIAVR